MSLRPRIYPRPAQEASAHHQRLGRLNQEIKRRRNVARSCPGEEACLRLVTALAVETSEEWVTGRRYLDMELLEVMGEAQETRETTKEVTPCLLYTSDAADE